MFKTIAIPALATVLFSSPFAFAKGKSTQPGWVAKEAFERKTGDKLDHTKELDTTYRFSVKHPVGGGQVVVGWNGSNRGPGAKNAYLMVVKKGRDRDTMVDRTVISGNLLGDAKKRVRAHLKAQGLSGKVEFGDHVTAGRQGELLQQPFSRESGWLRFTVTDKAGNKSRYLVETNPTKLVRGSKNILGKVELDNDTYGQKIQK